MPDQEKSPAEALPSLSEAIEKLMANPEIISMVASAIGNSPPSAESHVFEDKEEKNEESTAVAAAPSHADLGNILSNLAPLLSGLNKGGNHSSHESTDSAHNREALLCALRPYISQGRREAIDYILQLSRISELLKQVK